MAVTGENILGLFAALLAEREVLLVQQTEHSEAEGRRAREGTRRLRLASIGGTTGADSGSNPTRKPEDKVLALSL